MDNDSLKARADRALAKAIAVDRIQRALRLMDAADKALAEHTQDDRQLTALEAIEWHFEQIRRILAALEAQRGEGGAKAEGYDPGTAPNSFARGRTMEGGG